MQLASKIGTRTTNFCLNNCMMCTLLGDGLISWGRGIVAMTDNCSMWPLAVPTHTLGAVRLVFWNEAAGEI